MTKRSPTKGHLSWVSATHRCGMGCPRVPKNPAFLYQNVKRGVSAGTVGFTPIYSFFPDPPNTCSQSLRAGGPPQAHSRPALHCSLPSLGWGRGLRCCLPEGKATPGPGSNQTRRRPMTDSESSPLGGKRAGLEAQVSPGEP